MNKKVLSYNTKETILVITSFPNPLKNGKRMGEFNAIGEHSERNLRHLATLNPILVLAEKNGTTPSFQATKNLQVWRVWKKGNPFSILSLLSIIYKFNKVQSILVQFEFSVFGGIIPNLTLLLMLFLARIMGKRVVFELHQVITDVKKLQKHVYVTPYLYWFYNLGLKGFYVMLRFTTDQIVVFEEELRLRLSHFIPEKKIILLALSVVRQKQITQATAKKKLGLKTNEFVILVFGFINGYKGIDWIVNAMKNTKLKNVRLLVAGGKNPYMKGVPHYEAFYTSIVSEIQKHKHMTYHDFVPDSEITTYFSAANVVVMPYEVFMSASGPFSKTLAFGKPILLSDQLISYSYSPDFQEAANTTGVGLSDIFFPLKKASFEKSITKLQNKKQSEKVALFTSLLGKKRSIEKISLSLQETLLPKKRFAPSLIRSFILPSN